MELSVSEQARMLRQRGHAPKAIARALGVSTAEVVALLNADSPGLSEVGAASDALGCWVSAGWSRCVDLTEVPAWAGFDLPAGGADEDRALVSVLVARDSPRRSKVLIAGFLLDVWCLGVKNASVPEAMKPSAAAKFRELYFQAHEAYVPIPTDLARCLVHGAADYAEALGFEPHADFAEASSLLSRPDGPSRIRFGRGGKPFYINGPYDNPDKVLRTLRRTVGDKGFDYALAFPE